MDRGQKVKYEYLIKHPKDSFWFLIQQMNKHTALTVKCDFYFGAQTCDI